MPTAKEPPAMDTAGLQSLWNKQQSQSVLRAANRAPESPGNLLLTGYDSVHVPMLKLREPLSINVQLAPNDNRDPMGSASRDEARRLAFSKNRAWTPLVEQDKM
ncbi:uncharacterized protein Triagg1_2754 [Trichoderma aggressivum f. europaeum]|uniref:Uncharacterized protein n=1 Tax=Trichoderma aggressivum f. europaeum TaxID=173218 RepID=A0AAE1IGK9_9HYPO|nr:hypothetical protein Triagg1_2754 [Trichoderma aggressivum f. europaeum]